MLLHKGIRPEYETEFVVATKKRKLFDYLLETLPDGTKRYWNQRMLNSGCNEENEGFVRRDGLIYCEKCDEWFDEKQFAEIE